MVSVLSEGCFRDDERMAVGTGGFPLQTYRAPPKTHSHKAQVLAAHQQHCWELREMPSSPQNNSQLHRQNCCRVICASRIWMHSCLSGVAVGIRDSFPHGEACSFSPCSQQHTQTWLSLTTRSEHSQAPDSPTVLT